MKASLDSTLSRLGGYLAQLEQKHAPRAQTQPFQEALATLEGLQQAAREEAYAKQKAPSAQAAKHCE